MGLLLPRRPMVCSAQQAPPFSLPPRPREKSRNRPRRRRRRPNPNRRSANRTEDRMDEYEWYDDDEPYVLREPYVIIEKRGSGVGSLLAALALGAGVALLLAPQTGEETRKEIARRARRAQDAAQDFVEDLSGTVADKFQEVRSSVEERIEATLDAVDDKKRRVSNAYHVGRAAAREARGDLEQRIAESKAAY